jgi:hypothetical protein
MAFPQLTTWPIVLVLSTGFALAQSTPLAKPVITGTAQVGQPLTAPTYAYQWNRSPGGAIPGANGATYVPVAADVGKLLSVTVGAIVNNVLTSYDVSAAKNAVIAGPVPVNTGIPTISGAAQVGQTLTATNGTWTNSPASFADQWNRAGTPIGGATASTYAPVPADVGNTLTISVTATNRSGPSTPATSAATAPVAAAQSIIPADRNFTWNPGMMSKGGIPNRTTICATLSPSGGDDTAAIQARLDSCPSGQVVMLNPGTFIVNNLLLLHSPITLRGSGKGSTILYKTNGSHGRLPTTVAGTTGIHDAEPPYATGSFTGSISGTTLTITAVGSGVLNVGDALSGTGISPGTVVTAASGSDGVGSYTVSPSQTVASTAIASAYNIDAQPILIIGPSRWPGPDSSTSQALTADGAKDAFSVTIANAAGFAAGQFVLLDEKSGASWQPVPAGFGCGYSWDGTTQGCTVTPNPPMVWQGDRVAWAIHWPEQHWQDDHGLSNSSCPYDPPFVDCNTSAPAAMSWFSRKDRPTNEMKEVASVSGNTVTFTSPLSISYRTSHTAQLTRYTLTGSPSGGNSIHVTNAGVENLSMYGGADGELRFEAAAYSWAKAVEITQWLGEGVAIDNAFRIEIRDSYIHTGAWPSPGGGGYVMSFANASAEVLVENNIMLDTCKDMVVRSSGAGSVIAYNYADDPWDNNALTWQEVALNGSHMAGPHHMLFEGNYGTNFDSDYTHGNSIYMTVFRNVLTGQRKSFTDSGNMRAAGLAYGSWWDSFIGNLLGRSGQMSGWSYASPAMSCDANGNNCTGNNGTWAPSMIWELGYDPGRWNMFPDPQVLATVIRDGNYDYLTNSQRWHTTPGGFAIPNSMYLTSKPAFFGSNPWPWSDPTTGTIYTLPAKARYDAGAP